MAAGTDDNHRTTGLSDFLHPIKVNNKTYRVPIMIFAGHWGGEISPEGSAIFHAKPNVIRARAIRKLSLYLQGKAHVFIGLFVIAIVA
jgi:hypothetical protein